MSPAIWVHDLSPFLFRFSENFGIRYYGLAYLIGFFGSAWLLHRYYRAGKSPLDGNVIGDLITYLVFGVMLGGRLGYFILYQPEHILRDPLSLVRVWEGGMASHGAFVGGTLALVFFVRKHRVSFFVVSDLVLTTAPVGLLFGRIANFINGELYGKITDASWAVIFPSSAKPGTPLHLILPRHASQLYEAALEGALLLGVMQWRFWRTDVAQLSPGRLSGEFLIAYAVVRMIGEAFREPDASLLFGVSRGTFYSGFLIVAGLALVLRPAASNRQS
jgi:phosphatidylglycerol:prolipoprotein diacylglycerol transferase